MKAVRGILPSHPAFPETVLAENQPEFIPLPVAHVTYGDGQRSMISRYKLTIRERIRLLFTGSLWIEQITRGRLLQPQRLTLFEPLTEADDKASRAIEAEQRSLLHKK